MKVKLNQTYCDCEKNVIVNKDTELDVDMVKVFPGIYMYEIASGALMGLWLNTGSCDIIN